MKFTINNKTIIVKDEYAKRLKNNFEKVDEDYVKECILYYYTDDSKIPFVRPDINKVLNEKTEKELNNAVNFIICSNLEVMK